MINGEPKFSEIPPLRRHFLYGVNCYQFAIGYQPITVFTQAANPNRFAYLTLCPGNFAEKVWQQGGVGISTYNFKNLIRTSCQEDQLIELEQRSIHDPINAPDGERLIALYFAPGDETGPGDFHFVYLNNTNRQWEEKTPFADIVVHDHLPPSLPGGYIFSRFFAAKEGIQPQGLPSGIFVPCQSNPGLNFVENQPFWARGPVLKDHGNGLFLRRGHPLYAKPAWPEIEHI